jgi:hypothetical protein
MSIYNIKLSSVCCIEIEEMSQSLPCLQEPANSRETGEISNREKAMCVCIPQSSHELLETYDYATVKPSLKQIVAGAKRVQEKNTKS